MSRQTSTTTTGVAAADLLPADPAFLTAAATASAATALGRRRWRRFDDLLRRGGTRVVRKAECFDGGLMPLEARRLMSGSAGEVAFNNATLTLSPAGVQAAGMAVELDRDASHVRGVVTGPAGERTEGDWVAVERVKRISVAGTEGDDSLRLDARLAKTRPDVVIGSDVERVVVYHADGEAARRDMFDAFRLARQIGVGHSGLNVSTGIGRITDVDITSGFADLRLDNFRLVAADGTVTRLEDGGRVATGDVADGGIFVDPSDAGGYAFSGSVRFTLEGPGKTWRHVENYAPYVVHGDNDGTPNAWKPQPGTYTLTAETFTAKGAKGDSGTPVRVTFTVVDTPRGLADSGKRPVSDDTPHRPANNTDAPTVRIAVQRDVLHAGTSVHVDGLGTRFSNGGPHDATYEWDFGDAGSAFNRYRGFNAAHLYDKPGTYDITLRVTDSAGKTARATTTVRITAADRRPIHVDARGGDDRSNGLTPGSAVRTAARAAELLEAHGDDVEIRFRRGQTHAFHDTLHVRNENVVVAAYGTGTRPLVEWRGTQSWSHSMIVMHADARDVTVRGLAFTNRGVRHLEKDIANAIVPAGEGVAVVDNTFLDVSSAVLGSSKPDGLLVQGNKATTETGVRAYFVWGEGSRYTILGNTAVNSTREHIVRLSRDIRGVTISGNDFDNRDRRANGDRNDTAKGTLVIQHGSYAYVSNNTLRAVSGVGPLGREDGLDSPNDRWRFAVLEHNDYRGASFLVEHGAEHVAFRNNRMKADGFYALTVGGYDDRYDRTVRDLAVQGNLVINNHARGGMIQSFAGGVNLRLTGNTFVAPNLQVGTYGTAAFTHHSHTFGEWRLIDGNTWPTPAPGGWAEGGMHWVGTGNVRSNFHDPDQWNARPNVGDDVFRDADHDATLAAMLTRLGVGRLGA